jgi:hypothetical protein
MGGSERCEGPLQYSPRDWAGWGVGATNWSDLFAAVESWEIVWRSCESDIALNVVLKVDVEDMADVLRKSMNSSSQEH